MGIRDFFRRVFRKKPVPDDLGLGIAICTVCGERKRVCCWDPDPAAGMPPRCDLHCNHLNNEGRSMR